MHKMCQNQNTLKCFPGPAPDRLTSGSLYRLILSVNVATESTLIKLNKRTLINIYRQFIKQLIITFCVERKVLNSLARSTESCAPPSDEIIFLTFELTCRRMS